MSCVDYFVSKIDELYIMFYNMYRKENVHLWNPCDIFLQESSSSQYVVMVLNTPIQLHLQQHRVLNLWKNAILRITVDGGTNCWLAWLKLNNYDQTKNVAPDLITGDMDSLSEDVLQYFKKKNKNVRVIKTPDQDETDFTKALREVRNVAVAENIKIDTVIVMADTSGRFDQIIANINTIFKARDILPEVHVLLLAANSLTWLLTAGVVHSINIPLSLRQRQEWCSLIPIGSPCRVTSTGLKWDLNNTLLEFGKLLSTSNTYNGDPIVTIQTDNPLIWSMGIEKLL